MTRKRTLSTLLASVAASAPTAALAHAGHAVGEDGIIHTLVTADHIAPFAAVVLLAAAGLGVVLRRIAPAARRR